MGILVLLAWMHIGRHVFAGCGFSACHGSNRRSWDVPLILTVLTDYSIPVLIPMNPTQGIRRNLSGSDTGRKPEKAYQKLTKNKIGK